MQVEIAYADNNNQTILSINVLENSTIETAIKESGILEQFHAIDLSKNPVGIFSQKKELDHILEPNDRIEIYRPLICNPKQARRARANH